MTFSDPLSIGAGFLLATIAIIAAGLRLAAVADRLADRTGLGEALVGGALLGGATSLSGLTTSVSAAWNGLPELAISNAAGGIAGQTVFLVVADIAYRRANLEHAAASLENLVQGTALIGALILCLMAGSWPDVAVFGVHPFSIGLVAFYALGLTVMRRSREAPGWRAQRTANTQEDAPDEANTRLSLTRLLLSFAALAGVTAGAGWLLAQAAEGAIRTFGVSESLLGVFGSALLTSLPELITTVAAVRRGALTLAVGGIIGGNAFDTLFIAASDVAYREGSIFAAMTGAQTFTIGLAAFMSVILLLGLLRRQEEGPGRVGFETLLLLGAYVAGAGVLIRIG